MNHFRMRPVGAALEPSVQPLAGTSNSRTACSLPPLTALAGIDPPDAGVQALDRAGAAAPYPILKPA